MPLEIHPIANLLPNMTAKEYESLRDDIRAHGQRMPIVTHEGRIIDGRHRYRACNELALDPLVEAWDGQGGSPADYVISTNLRHRFLTTGQRGAIAAELLDWYERECAEARAAGVRAGGEAAATAREALRRGYARQNGDFDPGPEAGPDSSSVLKKGPSSKKHDKHAAAKAGKAANVSEDTVRKAKQVKESDPALHEQVKAGEVKLSEAHRRVKGESNAREKGKGKAKPKARAEVADPGSDDEPVDCAEACRRTCDDIVRRLAGLPLSLREEYVNRICDYCRGLLDELFVGIDPTAGSGET